ncbi:A24 family peptidase [Streptomyces sp. NBC_00523]|uniref:prepilin peptidase n=1 Tax=Streptomyces sp. NBC_00523 TaxID=2975765 RepID=UPI002E7FD810|nr:A24 family peptidase [Streptomyces sp. NBC_00523]WUD02079.1 A24 family peptidase [Streptomyces sp. NBC_00523]
MYAMLIGVAALWGAATGLLVPRAAYRFSVPPGDPWRDACPAGHPLTGAARAWLGATRCGGCAEGTVAEVRTGAPAPAPPEDAPTPRYAPHRLAPVVTALACAALAWSTGTRPELAAWLVLAPVAVLLASIDHRVHRLPDGLTLPAAGASAVLLGLAALLPEHAGSWLSALLGGLVLGAFYFLLFLVNPRGMGFGDVKLALSLGTVLGWYGWPVVFAGGFAGFLFGAVYGAALVALRRADRKTGIPFGPFMIAGAFLGLVFGGLAA